jgi:hypothetical protein
MRSTAAQLVVLSGLVVLPGLMVLTGCSSAHHSLSTSAGAPRAAQPSPTAEPSTAAGPVVAATGTAAGAAPAASVAGGSVAAAAAPAHRGSVTVAEVKPVAAHGTATAPVTCETSGAVYVALVSQAEADGYRHSFTVRVPGYHGLGKYRGTLSATVAGPRGTVAALTGVTDPEVTVTGTGGTFTIDAAGTGDHSLDATVSWICP